MVKVEKDPPYAVLYRMARMSTVHEGEAILNLGGGGRMDRFLKFMFPRSIVISDGAWWGDLESDLAHSFNRVFCYSNRLDPVRVRSATGLVRYGGCVISAFPVSGWYLLENSARDCAYGLLGKEDLHPDHVSTVCDVSGRYGVARLRPYVDYLAGPSSKAVSLIEKASLLQDCPPGRLRFFLVDPSAAFDPVNRGPDGQGGDCV